MLRRFLTRTNTGNKPILIFQIIRYIVWLERHIECVKVGKKHDHCRKERKIQRLSRSKIGQNSGHHRPGLCPRKRADGRRQEQQRACKDGRYNPGRVYFYRKMRILTFHNFHAHLTPRVLDHNLSQSALHEDHKADGNDHHDQNTDDDGRADHPERPEAKTAPRPKVIQQ